MPALLLQRFGCRVCLLARWSDIRNVLKLANRGAFTVRTRRANAFRRSFARVLATGRLQTCWRLLQP